MAIPCSALVNPWRESSIQRPSVLRSNPRGISPTIAASHFPAFGAFGACLGCMNAASVAANSFPTALGSRCMLRSSVSSFHGRFCRLKFWILQNLKFQRPMIKHKWGNTSDKLEIEGRDQFSGRLETSLSSERKFSKDVAASNDADSVEETTVPVLQIKEGSAPNYDPIVSNDAAATLVGSPSSLLETNSINYDGHSSWEPSLCIAVVGATGELARNKVFPALFALYYSGVLPESVGIFGYSRKDITDEDLRSIISSTLTCRVDHQENCGDKLDAFLSRTYYLNGGYNNKEGMAKLNARMEQFEGVSGANRIFYLSVPQEALLDVASSLADHAQTQRGWNRIIIEKPFGFDALSSYQLTQSLLAKFEEKQIYRIDHLLGKDLIENLTVLRFSNLVFEPLWSRTYIRNVQVILSEEWGTETRGRYFEGYGIIRDIVHSHILQTIALFAMEPPVSLDGEDIRNEKVKVLRSIRKLELDDIVLGQYKGGSDNMEDVYQNSLTPTFFAAALYIDNARWDGVPFLIKAGIGLIKHRVEIRIQFHHVPGNLYRERIGHNIDLATNELTLQGTPDEAIFIKVNNKVPGLTLQLDASELNLLYKDKYNVEIPDSYEHLLLDVVDGDNHLFMRSDELAAAWNILSPVLREMDKKTIAPELYEFGGRGPIGAYYLGAKHGVRWVDD